MNLVKCPEEDCNSSNFKLLSGRAVNIAGKLSYDVVCSKCGEYLCQFWGE